MVAQDTLSTKDRIVAAAGRLFYRDGVRAVSVDQIAEDAGVTKRTLYYHFASKDDLVAAYLSSRDQPNLEQFRRWFAAGEGDAASRLRYMFGKLARAAQRPDWIGCGFLRTSAELAGMPGHPAIRAGIAHKKRIEVWLADTFAASGIAAPEALARQVTVLLDGAFASALMHRDPAYIEAAGEAAEALAAGMIARQAVVS